METKAPLLILENFEAFLDELAEFPEGLHDDQVDALSGAYSDLTGLRRQAIPPPVSVAGKSHWKGDT